MIIDTTRDERLSEFAIKLLKDKYMLPHEKSPQEAFARAAQAFCGGDQGLADRIYEYASKGWISFSTPVLSNAGTDGLPISCYLSYVGDSLQELIDHSTEMRWMSVKGGGVGSHWSDIRSVSDKAPGPIPFLHTVDSDITAYHQGRTRRASAACYLDVSHPDFLEFLKLRTPTGDAIRKCLSLGFHHAVNISDKFMACIQDDGEWEFIDPHDKTVRSTMPARKVWEMILETRLQTGEPYLCFIDAANRALPSGLKEKGLRINGSNLCVAPETLVLTDKGHLRISDLDNKKVNVWNGYEFSKVLVQMTSSRAELIKIGTFNGHILECTPEHKFVVDSVQIPAKDLKLFMKVKIYCAANENVSHTDFISSIQRTGRYDATYCFTEPKRHQGVFNGILTGQCNEIYLPTAPDRSAVCCLSSVNLAHVNDWWDRPVVHDMIRFLDNVLDDFIERAPPELHNAVNSARHERSLGLGVMGFHTMLQKLGVPFGSPEALAINVRLFRTIRLMANEASDRLYKERGPCLDGVDEGVRNYHKLAVAPNANSSIIAGASPSIEPISSNAYTHKTRVGSFLVKNPQLEERLEEIGHNTFEVWKSIIDNGGSVQHLDFLTDRDKRVFLTAFEIDQQDIIRLAADRQPYICQGQSVNLFLPHGVAKELVSELHYMAWQYGLKGLYYCRTKAASYADVGGEQKRDALGDCLACE